MTLTKIDIVKRVRKKIHLKRRVRDRQQFLFPEMEDVIFPKKRADIIVDHLFEIIKETLEKGEDVLISGFGKFQVRFKWARKGRNPQTGKEIILKSRRIITFHCSSILRNRINRGATDKPQSSS